MLSPSRPQRWIAPSRQRTKARPWLPTPRFPTIKHAENVIKHTAAVPAVWGQDHLVPPARTSGAPRRDHERKRRSDRQSFLPLACSGSRFAASRHGGSREGAATTVWGINESFCFYLFAVRSRRRGDGCARTGPRQTTAAQYLAHPARPTSRPGVGLH